MATERPIPFMMTKEEFRAYVDEHMRRWIEAVERPPEAPDSVHYTMPIEEVLRRREADKVRMEAVRSVARRRSVPRRGHNLRTNS